MSDIENMTDEQLLARYKVLQKEVVTFNNFQMAKKILMNALFGACGQESFRYYDPRYAEGITMTGQLFIRTVGQAITELITKMSSKEGDWSFYSDTDSVTGDTLIYVNGKKIPIAEYYDSVAAIPTTTDTGTYVKYVIDDMSYCSSDGILLEEKRITYAMKHRVSKQMYSLKCNDTSVTVTCDHSIMVLRDGKLVALTVDNIIDGDSLVLLDGDLHSVHNFEIVDEGVQTIDVYDIEVEGVHNFFANDILVHNSCYFSLEPVLEKYIIPKCMNEDGTVNITKVIDAMDKIVNDKVTPIINAACDDVAGYTNSLKQLMNFKREALSTRGVWIAKKRYALSVIDNEGVRYAEPKTKVMGLEIVRSSTPAPVRKMLKDAVNIVLNGNEAELQAFCAKSKDKFYTLPPEEIAYPRGVQRLVHYSHPNNIYQKGCPIHVRGSLLFNHLVKTHGLESLYNPIRDGDKIKFITLKVPNTLRENVISFVDKLPKEFNLHRYVDYDEMWQTAFIAPLENIIGTIGWNHKEVASLSSLFD